MFVSYASDAILFMRTMKSLDYLPPMIIGDHVHRLSRVRFDETGQNVESATWLTQLQGPGYVTTWPEADAATKVTWAMEGWR